MRSLIWIAAAAATALLVYGQDVIKVNVELVQGSRSQTTVHAADPLYKGCGDEQERRGPN